MQTLLEVQRKLLPDFFQTMQKRYNILRYIKIMEPVGRRTLASNLHLTERTLRSEVDFLKDQNLIEVHKSGMKLSSEGKDLLVKLNKIMREVFGIAEMEQRLQELFDVKEVIVVPGDCDVSPWVKRELGKACALRMKQEWENDEPLLVQVVRQWPLLGTRSFLMKIANIFCLSQLEEELEKQHKIKQIQLLRKWHRKFKLLTRFYTFLIN